MQRRSQAGKPKVKTAADPAAQTLGQRLFAELDAIVGAVEGKHAIQLSGAGLEATVDKSTQRDGLTEEMRAYNRAAAYFAESRGEPGILDRFRMPTGHNDEQLVARHGRSSRPSRNSAWRTR